MSYTMSNIWSDIVFQPKKSKRRVRFADLTYDEESEETEEEEVEEEQKPVVFKPGMGKGVSLTNLFHV